ncbi:MAG TPA: molybdopterin converting factor subunit 1 [Thermoanaerobaculia bacterium]|nr:molybdopterin converting factor subunit 1 [Thermoanaerobaculia bacterium]
MRVRLLYFAVLRDICGKDGEELALSDGTAPRDVWRLLRDRHPELAAYHQPPLTAVNQAYASADEPLREGDELAFIPPVAGG